MKKITQIIVVLLASIIFPATQANAKVSLLSAESWNSYKKDPAATGYLGEGALTSTPALSWSYVQGTSGSAVVNEHGIMIMTDNTRTVESGCPKEYGRLRAFDYNTGTLLWQKGSCSSFIGMYTGQEAPAYANGKVFFNDEGFTSSDNAQTHAINSTTGEEIWTRNDLGYHTNTSPLAVDNQVLVGVHVTTPNNFQRLYSLNENSGATNWYIDFPYGSFEEEMAYDKYTNSVYLLHNENVGGYHLYKINLDSGSVDWVREPMGNYSYAAPTITESGVVVGVGSTYYHYDGLTGEIMWSYQVPGYVSGSTALAQKLGSRMPQRKIVVAWASSQLPLVVKASVLDLDTGEHYHTFQIETYGRQFASPLVVGDKVIFNTYFSHLKIFDINTGNLFWDSGRYDQNTSVTTPIILNNKLTTVGGNGTIVQWDMITMRDPAITNRK